MKDFIDVLLNHKSITTKEKNIINDIIKDKEKDLEMILNEIDGITNRDYFIGETPRNYFKDLFDTTPRSYLAKTLLGQPFQQELPLPDKSAFGAKYSDLFIDCIDLLFKIYKVIFDVYYAVDGVKVKNLYKPFFDIIRKKINKEKKTIPIFTTNYDKAIEMLSSLIDEIELNDGFQHISKKRYINGLSEVLLILNQRKIN
jgi:hypothetical protein